MRVRILAAAAVATLALAPAASAPTTAAAPAPHHVTVVKTFTQPHAASTIHVAPADTTTCVTHGEYDQLEFGMTVLQVANLFDIYGTYDGDSPNGTHFRRAYRTCWDPDDQTAIVLYSYATGWSNDWWIRLG